LVFLWIIWLTKTVRFQIRSKNIESKILFPEMLILNHVLARDSFSLNTHIYEWSKFLQSTSTSVAFHWCWLRFFLLEFFLYDVNQSYFFPISAKIFFRWCWLGLFSPWCQSWEFFVDVNQICFWSLSSRFF